MVMEASKAPLQAELQRPDISQLEIVLDIYNKLRQPSPLDGLAGTILLTRLKRAIEKLTKQEGGLPLSMAHITDESLQEIRERNLISSAFRALEKSRDPSLSFDGRLKQLTYVRHYIEKSGCGWQVLGCSNDDYCALVVGLYVDEIARDTTDLIVCDWLKDSVAGFLRKQSKEGILSSQSADRYIQKIDGAVSQRQAEIRQENVSFVTEILGNEHASIAEEREALEKAHLRVGATGLSRSEIDALREAIDRRVRHADISYYRAKIEEFKVVKGLAAYDALEELENKEFRHSGLSWEDVGFDKDEVEKLRQTWLYQGITDAHQEAERLLSCGDDSAAFKTLSAIRYYLNNDLGAIGQSSDKTVELYKGLLVTDVRKCFEATTKEVVSWRENQSLGHEERALSWQQAFNAMNTLSERLEREKIKPETVSDSFRETRKEFGIQLAAAEIECALNNVKENWSGQWVSHASAILECVGAKPQDIPAFDQQIAPRLKLKGIVLE